MEWTNLKCVLLRTWARTLKFYDVWIAAIFKNVPVRARAVLRAILRSLLLQLSLQFLHLRTRAVLIMGNVPFLVLPDNRFQFSRRQR